jgi:hypothetical protein
MRDKDIGDPACSRKVSIVDPANANEITRIALEVGADVFQSDVSYPSDTGS